jgi:hypothetical protein
MTPPIEKILLYEPKRCRVAASNEIHVGGGKTGLRKNEKREASKKAPPLDFY